MTTKDDIIVRAYQEGDEALILPLFREVFQTQRSLEHWQWKYRDNPFGRHKIAVAFTPEGALAGQYAGYAVPFYASVGNMGEFVSLQIGDIMTAPQFRKSGKKSVLNRNISYFCQKFCVDQIPFMYGFITGKHRKIGEQHLSYQTVSHVPYHVLDLSQVKINHTGRIKKIVSGLSIEKVTDIGPEYDLFFEKVCKEYPLLIKRGTSYLKWRYLACPDQAYRFFAVKRFGKLIGWSVFSIREDVLIWGDALFQRQYAGAVSLMLEHILHDQRPEVKRVEGWFSSIPEWWTQALRHAQFQVKPEPNGLVCDVAVFDERFTRQFLKNHFYFAMGDSDLF